MTATLLALFASIVLLALGVLGYIHLLDKLDGKGTYQPTRRQRRLWKEEQLVLPRAVVNRRRAS